ncbi:ABC transporter permease [Salimicrobium salexigens]|uniref:ABC-2 type transport system permease protein n=1 Tax=Salimicrobium salexigens TaxID=908941 RepID=A0ABY1KRG2_9BACI|nr:ABC transporter permease [Salimicrobium salexigens]SIS67013.1 ABC-2 type transport system permease protein [Salimicrobium salexigens]
MRNTWKVAKWEFKRNATNKSFIISTLLTPLIFLLFAFLPSLLSGSDSTNDSEMMNVYVQDEVGVAPRIEAFVENQESLNWEIEVVQGDDQTVANAIDDRENQALLSLTEDAIERGVIEVTTSEEVTESFFEQLQLLSQPIQAYQFEQLGLTEAELQQITSGIAFTKSETAAPSSEGGTSNQSSIIEGELIVPGIFSLIVLFAIVFTGMMIFQSASQEKKEKVSEIILSSMTPGELMQGKIIGYFGLGLSQVVVWLGFGVPIATWRLEDVPVLDSLLVPELLIMVFIAILGYLLFAALFVGFGATVEDISSSSNFQGFIMMLPFLPFVFIGPILNDPNGIVATIGSFIPFTSPAVLIMRMAMLGELPWVEIVIAVVVLMISVWLMIKLAGKIFEVGILMYGKNATPKEIWKWIRA